MNKSVLDVTVRDSVYEPGSKVRQIHYEASNPKRPRYRVWFYISGPDLPYVKSVTYTLHPTFPNPVRTVERTPTNPYAALSTWTWGLFEVTAEIEDKSGGRHPRRHQMRYDQELTSDAQYEKVELS